MAIPGREVKEMHAQELSYHASGIALDCVPLDIERLEQNTFHDRALRAEILKLFVSQLVISRSALLNPGSDEDWRFSTHTLKGAAAAVGAEQFVALSSQWEKRFLPISDEEQQAMAVAFDQAKAAFLAAAFSEEA
jgi:HPt (histidine-containing phosphotransfer) domain-containing protein